MEHFLSVNDVTVGHVFVPVIVLVASVSKNRDPFGVQPVFRENHLVVVVLVLSVLCFGDGRVLFLSCDRNVCSLSPAALPLADVSRTRATDSAETSGFHQSENEKTEKGKT